MHAVDYLDSMMKMFRPLRVRYDETGSAAVEFGLLAPLFILLLAGIVEFGMIMFSTVLMESALRDAARYGVTGYEEADTTRLDEIFKIVGKRTIGLVDMSTAKIEVLVYPSFDTIGQGEAYVDGNANAAYDAGETFSDSNGNGVWDADVGVAGAGGAGDVVVYRMQYQWPLLTPLVGRMIGTAGAFPVRASIAVRNEPWETGT